jgi:hypothetical protein
MVLNWLHRRLWQPTSSRRPRRRPAARKFRTLRLEALEERVALATFLVTNTADSGDGSLRQAILDADSGPGGDTIAFAVNGGGVQTIQPTSALPAITKAATIDGTTQPGFDGSPLVVVNGSLFNNGPNGFGFHITASQVTVRGLVVNGFTGSDFRLDGAGGDVIAGDYIGTDVTGTVAVSGASNVANEGLFILSANNTVGGPTADDRDLISGNYFGLFISGTLTTGNLVQGDYIGTDVTGTQALHNNFGVQLEAPGIASGGPGNTVSGNVISGNGIGVLAIDGLDNVFRGNRIGTDPTGTRAVPNGGGLELLDESHDTVGGAAAGAGNLISGNTGVGLAIQGSSLGTPGLQIQGNYLGTDVTGTQALPNAGGVSISSANVTVGGTAPGAGNLISGNAGNGVFIQAAGATLQGNFIGTDLTGTHALGNRTGVALDFGATNAVIGGTAPGAGNVISGNSQYGVALTNTTVTGAAIQGNDIGTNAAGTAALGNGVGVYISGSSGNTVGGTAAAARNVISGNGTGVSVVAANGNVVEGNYVGTDAGGSHAVGNDDGIDLLSGANTVGGTAQGAGNVISGNAGLGVGAFGSGNLIQGNLIGTTAAGTAALPNRTGISVGGANNTVGGTTDAARNVISGNGPIGLGIPAVGVQLFGAGATGNLIEGNYIGADVTGNAALGNLKGVTAESGATGNTLGGTAAGARNVISGNVNSGIDLQAGGNLVVGNYIGTNASGTAAVANPTGVSVEASAANTTVGGTASGAGNLISGNTTVGILVQASGALIQGNRIGTNAAGTAAVGNFDGAHVDFGAANATVGGTAAGARNLISGNGDVGVFTQARGTVIQGNFVGTDVTGTRAVANYVGLAANTGTITPSDALIGGMAAGAGNLLSGNSFTGMNVFGGVIEGNLIGTDVTGTRALGNFDGIDGAPTQLGGTAPGAGNVLSGNRNDGVFMTGSGVVIQGNFIGTNAGGTGPVPNGNLGIYLAASNNTLGGTDAGAANVISGNTGPGVAVYGDFGNLIEGNLIGTDVTGTRALGNSVGVAVGFGASNNTVGGTATGACNVISGNQQAGVLLGSNGNFVQGNFIGTDLTGTLAVGNRLDGVSINQGSNNTVGGTAAGARNVISGNLGNGVSIFGSSGTNATGNVVQGNYLGTAVTGGARLGNNRGVWVQFNAPNNTIGGTAAGAGNVVSGNTDSGIYLSSPNTTVQGNFVGTDAGGTQALGNQVNGITILTTSSLIGGTAAGAGNVISGNSRNGVEIDATGNTVQGNLIGTDASGAQALGNAFVGVFISHASNNTVGGTAAGAGNVISGNGQAGVYVLGTNATATGNVLQGNFIGTDLSGTQALPNPIGVTLDSAPRNTVGGTAAGAGNLISGNSAIGIDFFGTANQNVIQGNLIGTDASGTHALGGQFDGVAVTGGASSNQIGGASAGAGNVISGNGTAGVLLSGTNTAGNVVQGNLIGTDISGTQALGNQTGVLIQQSASNSLIGGTSAGTGNIISGNQGDGVRIVGSRQGGFLDTTGNVVQGNYIGTDVTGTQALGNQVGVTITGFDANRNTVGGTAAGAGNIISGNARDGVDIADVASRNAVQGDLIGTDVSGTQPLGNGGAGVAISNAFTTTVGGDVGGAGNTIAFNGGDGVRVDTGTGNAVRLNSIFANVGLGIALVNGGNQNQPAPTLTSVTSGGGVTTVQGALQAARNSTFTVDLYANPGGDGQGAQYLGSLTVTTDASGHATFTVTFAIEVPPGESITATATDGGNNTSRFSGPVTVSGA